MKHRVVLLIFLLGLTLADRAVFIYQELTRDEFGIRAGVFQGGLIIQELPSVDELGQPYPFHLAGVREYDRLVAIYNLQGEGGPINSNRDYGDLMRAIPPGEGCVAVVSRLAEDGRERVLNLAVPAPPTRQRTIWSLALQFGFKVYVPLLAALAAALIGLAKPRDNLAFLASLMFFAFSGFFLDATDRYVTPLREICLLFHSLSRSFMAYLVMVFFLLFPVASPIEVRFPWIKRAALAPVVIFAVFRVARVMSANLSFALFERVVAASDRVGVTFLLENVESPVRLGMIALGVFSLVANTITASSANERYRLQWLVFGTSLGLFPLFLAKILQEEMNIFLPTWFLIVTLATVCLFPLSFIYGVVRLRVFGIRVIVRRGLRYALVSRGFIVFEGLVIFALLHFLVTPLLTSDTGVPSNIAPLGTALAALLLALGIRRLNRRVLPAIDRRFFRDVYDARRVLVDLGRAARRLISRPDRLLKVVAEQILQSLHARQVAIFLADDSFTFSEDSGGEHAPELFRLHLHRYEATVAEGTARRTIEPEEIPLIASPFPVVATAESDGADPAIVDVLTIDPEILAQRREPADVLPAWRTLRRAVDGRLIVPLSASGGLLGFICLAGKLSEEPFSREDHELLLAVAEQVAVSLDYSRLVGQAAEQDRLRREMEIAKDVQSQLFPQAFPDMETLSYTGTCLPARGVGGDYFDFLKLDEHRMVLALGDISGKGVSAALLMASLQGALRTHAGVRGDNLSGLVGDLNRLMCASTEAGRFATLFCGIYDDRTRELHYVNAGHLPPIVVHPGGNGELSQVERLEPSGMVIGIYCENEYDSRRITLRQGDALVVFSDGLTEAEAHTGEMFDDHRVLSLVQQNARLGESALQQLLLAEVADFVGQAPQADDITTIVARVH